MDRLKNKKTLRYVIIASVLLLVFLLFRSTRNRTSSTTGPSNTSLNEPIETQEVKKEFTFPLRDSKGEEVGTIRYVIETVEIRDQILVKGQRATAVNGRQFMIINLKIVNQFSKTIQLNTRDYVRLAVNGNENEWLAPDIHNDPVEVQADSTKYTRIGFPVNTDDKDFILRAGEINGSKENIKLEIR